MTIKQYIKVSTKAAGVPMKVSDRGVLADVARMLNA